MSRKAVVLLQLGGPENLDAIEPFRYNLFSDPDIIDIPGSFLFRKPLARIISMMRTPKVREFYRRIGGGSPLLKQTHLQARELGEALMARGIQSDVLVAMRYCNPTTVEVVRELMRKKPDEVVLLPLYPHFSRATTGSSMNEWHRVTKKLRANSFHTKTIRDYHDHPLYIEALVENINRALSRLPENERGKVHLVFSAHGTPLKLVKQGDPYSGHIRRTYELVVERGNFGHRHRLCFQSKVGPQKWLEPSLDQTIKELAREKGTYIIVVPIAFVTDHSETLWEINIEGREKAASLGIRHFDMMPALITNKKFIACLADLVVTRLNTDP